MDHGELFRLYVTELRSSIARAQDWWDAVLGEEALRGTPEQALTAVMLRWPFGPAAHPYVVATYRKFFLACEEINRTLAQPAAAGSERGEEGWGRESIGTGPSPAAIPVAPWVLLVDGLRGPHNDLAEFMQGFVFQPVGLDVRTGMFT